MTAVPPAVPPQPPEEQGPTPPSSESRNWALVAHLSAFVAFVGVPSFVGPLVVWLMRRDTDPYAAEHGKEALNFNLTALIAVVVAALSIFVLVGFVLFPVVAIAWLVFVIIAAVKAMNGEPYRYPLTIRFIS